MDVRSDGTLAPAGQGNVVSLALAKARLRPDGRMQAGPTEGDATSVDDMTSFGCDRSDMMQMPRHTMGG